MKSIYRLKFLIFLFAFFVQALDIQRIPIKTISKTSEQKNRLTDKTVFGNYSGKAIEYKMFVLGVECKVCAKEVVRLCKKISWLCNPEFRWLANGARGYVVFKAAPREFVLDDIRKVLCGKGFSVGAIKGIFYGIVDNHQKNKTCSFTPFNEVGSLEMIFCDPSLAARASKKSAYQKSIFVSGRLCFDRAKKVCVVE